MKERGFGTVYLIIGVVVLAAAVAAWVYHEGVVLGLEHRISTLTKQNENLTQVNGQLSAENNTLRDENGKFKVSVERQNAAVNAALKERDDATVAYQKERAAAKVKTAVYEGRITLILAEKQRQGEQWYDTWARQVRAYVLERQNEIKARSTSGSLDGWLREHSEARGAYGVPGSRDEGAGAGEMPSGIAGGAAVVDRYGAGGRVGSPAQPGSPG